MSFIDQHSNAINNICAQHHVKKLYVFGSVLTDRFSDTSDIDLIVDFEPLDIDHYADNYFNLKFALEDILRRQIDLLEESTIRNPYFKTAVQNRRKLIYGN